MPGDSIKLVSYNILNGGLGRLDPIYETLLYLDADVIGLCEADDPAGVRYLAEKLGMDHAVMETDGGRAVAVISRLTIHSAVNLSVNHPALDRGAMVAEVGRDKPAVRFALAHLQSGQSHQDESVRLGQLELILNELADASLPTVLTGDLNAAAPYHPFDASAASPKLLQRLAERGDGKLDHDVVNRLTGAGWIDACHRQTADNPQHSYTTGFPCTRFDYIWLDAASASRLIAAGVEQGGFAPYCSDHFPVWADLRAPILTLERDT